MFTHTTPILATADVAATIAFYKDVLGFQTSWLWGDPPTFGAVNWGRAGIMFCLDPDLAAKVEGHQVWIDADDVDELYAKQIERGAPILAPIEDKPWGRREYTVRDPNGYRLRVAGFPVYESKGDGVFPEGVRIEVRMPTLEEFGRVTDAAFGENLGRDQALACSWGGVVALGPDGQAIGCVRIMRDGAGWFSIWDVGVMPEWQGRRIGSAMMEAAVKLIQTESPGAHVHLFTLKGPFYERLGFEKQTVHGRRV